MNDLEGILSNIEKDNAYRVVEVIKDSAHSRTERVLSLDGTTYIRKYFPLDIPGVENESRLLSQLSHTSLPKVHDYYELSGKGVLIQENISGTKLSDIINLSGTLSEPKAIDFAKKLCVVCNYLHKQHPMPIIHRDVKPDNIICTNNGGITLIDFGSAREYKENEDKDTVYVGTIGYAPPEQFGFGQTDIRTDVYGIGMTLLTMLTGKAPERGQKIRLADTNISVDIQRIIHNATQFDPKKRYQSVSALLSELNNLVPVKSGIAELKESVLRSPNNIFPKHLKWPAIMKWLLMPLHIMLILTFVVIMLRNIFEPSGYGRTDDIIRFLTDLGIFLFVLLPPYILGLNIFNLNEKIPFFRKRRLLKKTLIIVLILLIGVAILRPIGEMHTEAYKIAQNLADS